MVKDVYSFSSTLLSQFQVITEFSPLIAESSKNATAKEGDEIFFEVRLVSVPEPQITWYKDGKPIGPDPEKSSPKYKFYYHSQVHSHTRGVVITDVKRSDKGKYEIIAWNRLGQVSCASYLTVQGN